MGKQKSKVSHVFGTTKKANDFVVASGSNERVYEALGELVKGRKNKFVVAKSPAEARDRYTDEELGLKVILVKDRNGGSATAKLNEMILRLDATGDSEDAKKAEHFREVLAVLEGKGPGTKKRGRPRKPRPEPEAPPEEEVEAEEAPEEPDVAEPQDDETPPPPPPEE